MYNLSHIYVYILNDDKYLNKAIKLLNRCISINPAFEQSCFLLCIIFIKKYGFDFTKIKDEMENTENISDIVFDLA